MPKTHSNSLVEIPQEIADWINSGSTVPLEFIIQADLPRRSVSVRRTGTGNHQFDAVSGSRLEREHRLATIGEAIRKSIVAEPIVLSAAGAFSVSLLPDELRRICELPGIRAVQFNRKLR